VIVHLLDIEWLLSTLFDASLLKPWAAGNGGSFLCPLYFPRWNAPGTCRIEIAVELHQQAALRV
jgi:hypothetical protein